MARRYELDVTPEGLVQLMADLSQTRNLIGDMHGVPVRVRLLNTEEPFFRVVLRKDQFQTLLAGLSHSRLLERYQQSSEDEDQEEGDKPFGFAK